MSDETHSERLLHRVAKAITAARIIATCCTVVAGAAVSGSFWLGYSGPSYARDLIRSAISEDLDKINLGLANLGARVTALEPQPDIVEVDRAWTQVRSPCANGVECGITVRARRTNWGRQCRIDPASTQAVMVDSRGVSLPIEFRGGRMNLNHNFRVVDIGFTFDRAAPGDALVEIVTEYSCPRDGGASAESQKVLSLEFEVVSPESERLLR